MNKLQRAGAIATSIALVAGFAMLAPTFLRADQRAEAVLFFNIIDESNVPEWCTGLSSILENNSVEATVFITGRVAEDFPQCISEFHLGVDVGSQTYDYVDLTSLTDYTTALEEVRKGKQAVDSAGRLDSKLFKAPFGSTDDNIYSLLERSKILADFSYTQQYNKYENGKFIKYDAVVLDASELFASESSIRQAADLQLLVQEHTSKRIPIIVEFDNHDSLELINEFISLLKTKSNLPIVNASHLTDIDLVTRWETN